MRNFPDIAYGPDEMQKLDLWLPDDGEFDLYIHLHGGGIVKGSRKVNPSFAEYLTSRGIGLCSVEYRMYPNAKYPDFICDSAAATAFIKEHIGEYGKCKRIFLGGSSAGGYLSMMLCFDSRWFGEVGMKPTDIAGYFHDAGQPTAHFNVLKYDRGIDSRRIIVDDTAPLYHIGAAEEYSPMRFIVSDNDMKNRFEQTMLVLSTLKHFEYDQSKISHVVMHGTHCKYTYPDQKNDQGESLFGEMIFDFISTVK
ncbi:MAG: alpha/beta hydrolase [Clostridia bacterium]|nr:alpha/beta hydrolase [Clostridia bacterium]